MYKNVIDIKEDVSAEVLERLRMISDEAFDNRAGKVINSSDFPYRFVFEGSENEYACLEVGMLKLKRQRYFLENLISWRWVDEDPDECCDLLKLFSENIARGA